MIISKYISALLLVLVVVANGYGQQAYRQKNFNIEKGVAIYGYDPVAYFSGTPQKGKEALSYTYQGISYRFATEDHLNKFKANPAGYEPQYGGWCAYAMGANGEKVEINPETYKILDGKLYLFYNKLFTNTLKSWNKDEHNLKVKAEANWQKFK